MKLFWTRLAITKFAARNIACLLYTSNCGLPYYIGDVITDPEELTLQTPESFFKRFRINMKIHHEVISIHPERKTVSVKNLENGEIFEEKYDKLILSPGAKPTQPRLPGGAESL